MTNASCFVALIVFFFVSLPNLHAEEEKVPLEKLPKPIVEAVKKRFPKAELVEATKEMDQGKTQYEVTLKDGKSMIDVMLTPEGVITLIEKEIRDADLPAVVKDALEKKYPKATYKTVEEIIDVKKGKESLTAYEVELVTANKKLVEVKVSPDGKKLEEDNDETDAKK